MSTPWKDALLNRIPPKYRQTVVDVKNAVWGGYRHTYYSQFGEDIILSSLLPKKGGFFVDVGANHPKRYSNTYLLYKHGWRGINVDPNADAMRLFTRTRPFDTNIVAGVANTETTMLFYRFSDPAYNTFSKEMAEQAASKNWITQLPSESVSVCTLASLLTAHMPSGKTIDLLSIDVEGLDFDVLSSNDWGRFRPNVIAIEDHTFDANDPQSSRTYTYLLEHGYSLKALSGPTLIFVTQR